MYQVTSAFLEQMKSPIQEHKITGTIGSVSFDEANIVEGSFSISNQSTDTNDVVLGSCYVGQLTAEFTGINIEWGKWINKTITPTFSLNLGNNTWESVPLGIFKVKEAKHTDHGVQVTAYDNMIKFDKKFRKSHYMNLSGMWNIISQICTDAGVTLGMTRAQIEALPNGDRTGINIYGSTGKKAEFANDITTLRDLLFWVAQTLGCFATINRAGQLEFRQYTQDVVDNISNVHRIEGATFADYITHYVGIYVENLDDNTEDYYGYDVTALQQELTETMGEITQDQEDITDLEADRADWVQKLANHECTQQEYDAAIAEINAQERALTKEINQLSKRAEWLSNAISMSADDGSDMVLGANPLTMAKNLTTRDQQRREILGALNAISYTPFQASVLCGCIYDLGDVIQFSGGLYNSDTDSFGCVMQYTYTHNGGTELEGFGVDPSVVVVRNKTQKSTDRASKNAVNAKESFNGYDTPDVEFPTGGKDGDIYIKRATRTTVNSKYPIEYDTRYFAPGSKGNGITLTRVDLTDDGYFDFGMGGQAIAADQGYDRNYNNGAVIYKAKLDGAGTYKWHCKINASYSQRNSQTAWAALGFRMGTTDNDITTLLSGFPLSHGVVSNNGFAVNLSDEQNTDVSYSATINISDGALQDDYIYIWFTFNGVIPITANDDEWRDVSYIVKDFFFEKLQSGGTYDGGTYSTTEEYIDKVYTYIKDDGEETGRWVDIEYVANVEDGSWDGLKLNYKRYASLKNYVMRAWYKADPPQIERDFSQFCARYTGIPDKQVAINHSANHVWQNVKISNDDDNVFKIKCKGTYDSGEINYVVYAISGLVVNKKYYFNFRCDFSNNAIFSSDGSIGCGLVFNTTGILSTSSYSGTPDHFDPETGYYAFMRQTGAWYADFELTAAASTMYMCVLTQAVTTAAEVTFTMSEMVIAQEERKLIRNIYLYDYTAKEWLKYKPFTGTVSGGDEGGSVVSIEPTLSQGTKIADFSIDGNAGELYAPDNSYTLPIASANTLGGIKVGANLSIDPQTGVLSASAAPSDIEDLSDVNVDEETLIDGQVLKWDATEQEWVNEDESGGSQAIEITKAAYDLLPSADKNDPNKVYYITDYPTPSGIDLGDIDDVDLSSPTDGQVLKYDGTNQKWINANESGGGTPSMSDWGWNVLHKTIEWSGGFAPDAYSLVSYIEYVKPSSMIGKMVIVQGVHVYGSTDGTTFNDTLDFDLHYVYNRTNQSDEEVVYIGGLVHNHSSVTFTHLKFSANVIYI